MIIAKKINDWHFAISATTTNDEIKKNIPYLDMQLEAIERRDDAAAVLDEQGDQTVLQFYKIENVDVLFSSTFGYAFVNEQSNGISDSLFIGNDECESPEYAVKLWQQEI